MAEIVRREGPAASPTGRRQKTGAVVPHLDPPTGHIVVPFTERGMTEAARQKFAEAVEDFSAALERETARLEEAERDEDVREPEITATMVIRANEVVRRGPLPESERDRSVLATSIQVVGLASLAAVGVLGSYLRGPLLVSIFIVLAVIALVANGYAIRRRL
ncbi:hypothetical protein AB0F15_00760 [Amycolatopsis sp. NPDC026612]|uniref:hypothetical protein n=1 Tax=Amycolatopsis sp. NPDC026612 TaxID=3155466 RepID=UPI0033D7F7B0